MNGSAKRMGLDLTNGVVFPIDIGLGQIVNGDGSVTLGEIITIGNDCFPRSILVKILEKLMIKYDIRELHQHEKDKTINRLRGI